MSVTSTKTRIPVSGPWITEREIAYVTDAVTNAWYANAGLYHDKFEAAFRAHLGASTAISLPSCTSGIHLVLAGLGIGPGDEVIVPDATWIASAAPITYVGATPVFADVDRATWCLDPASFEACITPRTKAVIAVDLYGSMPDFDAIRRIADAHGVFVLEDAAEAIGSTYKGKNAGTFGDASVFSFHGSKTVTTGEGGLVATNRADLTRRMFQLRDHGRAPGDTLFFNLEVGFKYKMSSMQAALGLAQLERLGEIVAKKRQVFQWYVEELGAIADLALNAEPAGTINSYWMVTIVPGARYGRPKLDVIRDLSSDGIDARPFFHPLSSLPAYATCPGSAGARERNLVSYDVAARGVNLPSGPLLTREDVARVSASVRRILSV